MFSNDFCSPIEYTVPRNFLLAVSFICRFQYVVNLKNILILIKQSYKFSHPSFLMYLNLFINFLFFFSQPLIYGFFMKSPVPPNFLTGKFSFLSQFVKRRFGNLQISRKLINRHYTVFVLVHYSSLSKELVIPDGPGYSKRSYLTVIRACCQLLIHENNPNKLIVFWLKFL